MLLSRFWYGILALALGAATFLLFVGVHAYTRSGARAMAETLSADSSAVDWYLRDDARKRSSALIAFTLSTDIANGLAKASGDAKIDRETRMKTTTVLRKLADEVAADVKFDAVWAVDANGRVVAASGFEHTEEWELGGYATVADALHGWIRDDAWVWRGRIYRIVARPIEKEAGGEPVGAVIGARIIDDTFARAVTKRTGAAVGFYADGTRVASGAPEGFDKSNLDEITRDLKLAESDKDYLEKGRSNVRVLSEHLGVVYARLPGEAWDLGAGYAVGRLAVTVKSPFDFLNLADTSDKEKVPRTAIIVGTLLLALFGLGLTFLEHTRPLAFFRKEAERLAKGDFDAFQPSRFRGAYRQIATEINDGIERVVVKGGGSRRAADLQQVLGVIPKKPMMSAFAVPGAGDASEPPSDARPTLPTTAKGSPSEVTAKVRASAPEISTRPTGPLVAQDSGKIRVSYAEAEPVAAPPARAAAEPGRAQPPPPPKRPAPPSPESVAPESEAEPISAMPASVVSDTFDELQDWRNVYAEFLAMKKQCGEATATMTFDKFKGTLQRNKDALVARHNCTRVKFTVYQKEGKAALKASPVK